MMRHGFSPALLACLAVTAMARTDEGQEQQKQNPNENPLVGQPGSALDRDTNATTAEAAGPPINTPTREELAQSGYRLPEVWFEEGKGGALPGEQKAATGPTSNKAAAGPAENKGATTGTAEADTGADALADVQFASPAARAAAVEAGLSASDFSRKRKSSDKGFTAADVERIAGAE